MFQMEKSEREKVSFDFPAPIARINDINLLLAQKRANYRFLKLEEVIEHSAAAAKEKLRLYAERHAVNAATKESQIKVMAKRENIKEIPISEEWKRGKWYSSVALREVTVPPINPKYLPDLQTLVQNKALTMVVTETVVDPNAFPYLSVLHRPPSK